MRKFIISDLHGDGKVYKTIMSYLDNLAIKEDIVLYINGDLIDRGPDTLDMLIDIRRRIKDGPFKIVYLAGNHELMLYEFFTKMIKGLNVYQDIWYRNGGKVTEKEIYERYPTKGEVLELVDFISSLKIYHKFKEKIDGKSIVLVHASCPLEVEDKCNLKIKDDTDLVYWTLWTREYNPGLPFRGRIGNKDYFSIVGHSSNDNKYGYEYHDRENYLNIDGGCSKYVYGIEEADHVPLVEIKDDYLKILTFNHNNEIIYGNYYKNYESIPYSLEELDEDRKYVIGR